MEHNKLEFIAYVKRRKLTTNYSTFFNDCCIICLLVHLLMQHLISTLGTVEEYNVESNRKLSFAKKFPRIIITENQKETVLILG